MSEFAPVQTEDTGDIDKFEIETKGQPGLGEENYRLEHYLKSQEELIKKHLKTTKEAALDEYTSANPFSNDNEAAVNQAMQDYADKMNEAIEASLPDLQAIIKENENLYNHIMKIEDVQKRISEMDSYYKLVANEWGPKLEEKIINIANVHISSIVDNAEKRADEAEEAAEKEAEEPEEDPYNRIQKTFGSGLYGKAVQKRKNRANRAGREH